MEGIHNIIGPIRSEHLATSTAIAQPVVPPADEDRFERGPAHGASLCLGPAPDLPPDTLERPSEVDPLLVELGFDEVTGTIQQLPRADAIAAARACGELLETHTRIYGDYLREKLLLSVRAYAADYVRGRDDSSPVAARLDKALSLSAVAELLDATPHLGAALRFAARKIAVPLGAALAKVTDADSLALLDDVEVVIVDLDGSGTIDERDILALEIGGHKTIGPVGRELADRLRMSACILKGMDELVDSWTGCSRLTFTSAAFDGPDTWFRVERDYFALRQEKDPDKPWLTRARSASAALRHVRDNADDYTMDCAAAISAAWFLGKYHEIGELAGERQDEVFDRVTPHLTIGKWHVHWSNVLQRQTVEVDPRTDVPLPGESRYFKAADISPRGQLAGWQGENVLFYGIAQESGPGYRKGERIWYGHPFGLTAERHIIETLNSNSFDLDADGLPALQAVMAAMPDDQALARELVALEKQVTEYQEARDQYEAFMKVNRRTYMGLRERKEYLEREHQTADPEYHQVRSEFLRLREAMATLDNRSTRLARAAAVSAQSLRGRLVQGTTHGELVAALDQLLPAPSALHTEGRVLRPYRAFQDGGNNAVELV